MGDSLFTTSADASARSTNKKPTLGIIILEHAREFPEIITNAGAKLGEIWAFQSLFSAPSASLCGRFGYSLIFFWSGRGKGESEAPRGGGGIGSFFFFANPRRGGGVVSRRGSSRGARRVSAANLGILGAHHYEFSGNSWEISGQRRFFENLGFGVVLKRLCANSQLLPMLVRNLVRFGPFSAVLVTYATPSARTSFYMEPLRDPKLCTQICA